MLKLKNMEVVGWEHAIRGMRNPKNSWDRSDSWFKDETGDYFNLTGDTSPLDAECDILLGDNDHKLMMNLADGGPVHAKYRRMITVYVDITAPLYWWKEFDTYKVGTVANSCSTMHKIGDKKFEMSDFSTEHLMPASYQCLGFTVKNLNAFRECWLAYDKIKNGEIPASEEAKAAVEKCTKKDIWWQMIQLLPTSYNQKRTVMLNYEVLVGIYKWRRNHKLDEWHTFCDWIEELPYSELIIGAKDE